MYVCIYIYIYILIEPYLCKQFAELRLDTNIQ